MKKKFEDRISDLQKKKEKLLKSLEKVDNEIEEVYNEQYSPEDYASVEVSCVEKDKVYIFQGGFNSERPIEFMKDAIEKFCKERGYKKYNLFIENHLDNPFIYILVIDFHSLEFDRYMFKKR